jgi:hypothetical protein
MAATSAPPAATWDSAAKVYQAAPIAMKIGAACAYSAGARGLFRLYIRLNLRRFAQAERAVFAGGFEYSLKAHSGSTRQSAFWWTSSTPVSCRSWHSATCSKAVVDSSD